jgi:hypothetical protein
VRIKNKSEPNGSLFHIIEKISLEIKHSITPTAVGKRNANAVFFMLDVSFFTVRSVVEQGQ